MSMFSEGHENSYAQGKRAERRRIAMLICTEALPINGMFEQEFVSVAELKAVLQIPITAQFPLDDSFKLLGEEMSFTDDEIGGVSIS